MWDIFNTQLRLHISTVHRVYTSYTGYPLTKVTVTDQIFNAHGFCVPKTTGPSVTTVIIVGTIVMRNKNVVVCHK